MAAYDFRTPRLYVTAPLEAGATVALDRSQSSYLVNVMRRKPGDSVLLFNGRDGEWLASLSDRSRKTFVISVAERTRAQTPPGDLHYLFAPLKQARLDYMVQKAVELGVSRLVPVLTRHGQVQRVNGERMRANAIEAAEQCGILALPEIAEPIALTKLLAEWIPSRLMVFCDEDAPTGNPVEALAQARGGGIVGPLPVSVLVGPEGGFAPEEREELTKLPNMVRLSLGPRILRADTAAVAVLALVQAVLGDWK